MHLVLTQYIDTAPETVRRELDRAIGRGLSAAADRLDRTVDHMVLDHDDDHDLVRIRRGLAVLVGAEIRVTGQPRLASVEVSVPWQSDDHDGHRFRAANILAQTIGQEAQAAA